jgi:hypothetical protein
MSTAMHAGTGTRLGQRLGKERLEGSLPGLKRNRGSLEMLELDASCTTNDLLCPQTVYFRPPCRPHGSRGASDLRNTRWKENPGARRARGRQRLEAGSRGQQPHVVVDVTDLHSLSALANAILARWLAGRPPDGGRWRSCACVHFGKQIAGVLLLGGGGAASGLALATLASRHSGLGGRPCAMDTVRTPQLLQGDTFPHYPTCTRTIYSIYSAFYSCGLAVHLSNDPSSP